MGGIVIAVDPGEWSGVAVFKDGTLIHSELVGKGFEAACQFVQTCSLPNFHREPVQGVIEIPQVYQQRQWKGDPNDLIGVAVLVGVFGSWLRRLDAKVKFVKPHEWKGSRPKVVDIKYTMSLLTLGEKTAVPELPQSKLHNVIDAIGIGLWQLKRR